jgi:hypothetical protein
MIRTLAALAILGSSVALAQSMPHHGPGGGAMAPMMRDHGAADAAVPSQPGQAAFAAIQEIVGMLEADPRTDWSKVDIDALRQHLVDMNNVTLAATVASEPVPGGMRFVVSGTGAVQDSIRRMVAAHAATMNGVDGWRFEAATTETGATLTVLPPAADAARLRGLGFFGVMTRGMHHQAHHLMLARGENPHQ